MAHRIMGKLGSEDQQHGEMGIAGYSVLLDKLKEKKLTMFNLEVIETKVKELVKTSIEYDINQWANYGVRPSRYILTKDSIYYEDNKEIVDEELEYLIKNKPDQDVWGITWTWFDNNEKYAKEFAISENWWKSIECISKLRFLRNFEKVEHSNS